jgi:hypothetical protein
MAKVCFLVRCRLRRDHKIAYVSIMQVSNATCMRYAHYRHSIYSMLTNTVFVFRLLTYAFIVLARICLPDTLSQVH